MYSLDPNQILSFYSSLVSIFKVVKFFSWFSLLTFCLLENENKHSYLLGNGNKNRK